MTRQDLIDRRTFLKYSGLLALSANSAVWSKPQGVLVNDLHSQLNPTRVNEIIYTSSRSALSDLIKQSAKIGSNISLCGGRHAGGGQQFIADGILIDTGKLNRVLNFDPSTGLLEVEAGIRWPQLLEHLNIAQEGQSSPWGIAQKQTGADLLSVGGTLGANAHGQGLRFKPFISNIESFVLIDANGEMHKCSRVENPELFRLVIGGYGLFGIVYSVNLRLIPRKKVRRLVQLLNVEQVIPTFENCVAEEYPYGDFQFNIDENSEGFLHSGVFSGYELVPASSPILKSTGHLSEKDWVDLVYEAHIDKKRAFEKYTNYLLSTSGRVNWSDAWQTSTYVADYHSIIDRRLHSEHKATEVLTEIYVPKNKLADFIGEVRADFLKNNVNLIYSTVRFIEKDDESFLPWAKESYACIIFNLHTVHTLEGIEHSADAFRRLIDLSIKYGGSYYLTYHKYARHDQVLACYPQFKQFLDLKLKYDPQERFQSDWYRHYKKMFG